MKPIILNNILCFIFLSVVFSEQIDKMINNLLTGKNRYSFSEIRTQIQDIPSDGDKDLILKGLLEIDGEKSFNFFKDYIDKNKSGDYSSLALSRIADYYYTEGLYSKSSKWYKKLLFDSKSTENLVPSINYFINSLAVSGELDSAKYYTKVLKNKFPRLNFNSGFYLDENNSSDNNKSSNRGAYSEKSYYVEIGLYERYSDATYNRSVLLSSGFLSRIDEVLANEKTLYALRVGYYSDIQKAENIKRRIRSRLGLTNLEIMELK